jgi:hypothetical protein
MASNLLKIAVETDIYNKITCVQSIYHNQNDGKTVENMHFHSLCGTLAIKNANIFTLVLKKGELFIFE